MENKRYFDVLQQIYQDLESDLKNLADDCKACGSCCEFSKETHLLFASRIEWEYLFYCHGSCENIDETTCPFIKESKCTARDGRTLACRIFFCDSLKKDEREQLYEKYLDRIKELHKQENIEWTYSTMKSFCQDIQEA